MITQDRLEKALRYLAETDEQAAELKVDVERQSFKLKKVKAAIFLHSDGNIEERKSAAETADETVHAEHDYLAAYQQSEAMNNKRKTEELITRIYQTESANRRQG